MESLHYPVYQFGKLFQICKATAEEIFREDRVNELHREVTHQRALDVPEVLDDQVVPSPEVRMVSEVPSATNNTPIG